MFSLKRRVSAEPLLNSRLYDEQSFYRSFIADLKHCKQNIVIESPYLTCKRSGEFAKTFRKLKKRGVSVRIYTREPRHHNPRLRDQSIKSIEILKKSGVKVYVCSDRRHRKIATIDNIILWEGSLNILSQRNSREIMRRTVSPQLCKQMLSFTGINRWCW